MNLNDQNYLLVDEIIPDNYIDTDLREVANSIMTEFDTLRGTNLYNKWVRESGYKQNQENKIIVLAGILQLFQTEPERALNVIKECNFKYKTKKDVQKALNNRLFDQKVEKAKEEAKAKLDESEKKIATFEDFCVPIEAHFKGVTLDYDITVAKYCSWEKRYKEDISRKTA